MVAGNLIRMLPSVWKQRPRLLQNNLDREYLPNAKTAEFRKASAELALDENREVLKSGRYVTMHEGHFWNGSLKDQSQLSAKIFKFGLDVSLPQPFWGTHTPISTDAGMQLHVYLYYDPKTCGYDFTDAKKGTAEMPAQSVLHACAVSLMRVDLFLSSARKEQQQCGKRIPLHFLT